MAGEVVLRLEWKTEKRGDDGDVLGVLVQGGTAG